MIKDTVCRLCSTCCPVEAHIENSRLVKAHRKSPLPESKRLPCPKLAQAPEITYSPLRLKKPLVRDNVEQDFKETSWDEALGRVSEKFLQCKKEHGAQSIAWLRGMAADWGSPWDYANRLMNALGSPNSIGNGSVCHVAREMAHNFTYGAMALPQPGASKCILIWGKNDINTCPPAGEAILKARREGAALIVVDPIRTPFAEIADIWLQIKPGHDGWLALAMINEIIENSLYDKDFVRDHTIGFSELKEAARDFPSEKVAKDLWLTPEEIKKAARLYATTRPACIVEGNGLDMQLNTFQATRAVSCLRALSGNLDKPGGDFMPQPVPMRPMQLAQRVPQDVFPVTREYDLFNSFHPTWGLHAQSCLVDAILEEKPYPVRTLMVQSGNPVVTMTDSARVEKAFKKLDFMVAMDLFMNRTAQLAHVVLPSAGCFEKTQLNRAYTRNSPVILQDQVIDCVGESWPDWKIIFELARRLGLGPDFPWESVDQAIDFQLEPSGITVDKLRQNPGGVRTGELCFEKHLSNGFPTPSGKVEFTSERLASNRQPAVPFSDGGIENPISFSEQKEEYNMVGISGERCARYTHSQFRGIPGLNKKQAKGQVDIHPDDAAQKGIQDQDDLEVSTPRGRIRMKARISQVVHPGSVMIAWGWGELGRELSLNNLTDDDRRDPVTATPSNRSFWCRVEKVSS